VKVKIMHFIAGSIWPFSQDYQADSQFRNDALLYICLGYVCRRVSSIERETGMDFLLVCLFHNGSVKGFCIIFICYSLCI
jgi:hypothetical protein